jgi:hypothetical protein
MCLRCSFLRDFQDDAGSLWNHQPGEMAVAQRIPARFAMHDFEADAIVQNVARNDVYRRCSNA